MNEGARKTHLSCLVIVIVLLGLGAVMLTPPFLTYRRDSRRTLCLNNLRAISRAKVAWAKENNATNGQIIATNPEAIWAALRPWINQTNAPCCVDVPSGTHYFYNPIGVPPACPIGGEHVDLLGEK